MVGSSAFSPLSSSLLSADLSLFPDLDTALLTYRSPSPWSCNCSHVVSVSPARSTLEKREGHHFRRSFFGLQLADLPPLFLHCRPTRPLFWMSQPLVRCFVRSLHFAFVLPPAPQTSLLTLTYGMPPFKTKKRTHRMSKSSDPLPLGTTTKERSCSSCSSSSLFFLPRPSSTADLALPHLYRSSSQGPLYGRCASSLCSPESARRLTHPSSRFFIFLPSRRRNSSTCLCLLYQRRHRSR